jgi:PadR family transcriptional regulator, regulatory protein AphA
MTPASRAILGLLSIVPMSGYDLAHAADAAVGRFWPVSKSQVYAELARLEPLGLVQGTEIAQERRPDKRVFRLTGQGEEALDAWLESDELGAPRFRLPFLLKIFLGHRMAPRHSAELLQEVRAGALAQAGDLEALLAVMDHPDAAYARLTVSLLLRLAETVAAWAQDAGAGLPPGRIGIDPNRAGSTVAAAMFKAVPAPDAGEVSP